MRTLAGSLLTLTWKCQPEPFSPEDFARIEQRMAEIVDRDLPIVREVWDRPKIKQYFVDHGEKFKAEWADELPKDEIITVEKTPSPSVSPAAT